MDKRSQTGFKASCRNSKGQSAVELLIVLSLALAVLSVLVALSYSQLSTARASFYQSQAQASLNSLGEAARIACGSGVGSKRFVQVAIPPTILPESVFVSGNLAGFSLSAENGLANVNFYSAIPLQGRLPNSSGDYVIPVECREGYVLIGEPGLQARPTLVHAFIGRPQSIEKNITVTNNGESPLSISNSLQWPSPSVAAGVSPASMPIPAHSSSNVTVSFSTTGASEVNSFSGSLNISSGNETALVELIVDVV